MVHVVSPEIDSGSYALLHEDIPPVIDEAAQTLGNVKVTEYALPGSPEMAQNAIDAIGAEGSACLLANHGAVAVGKDMDTALKVCTVLEMTAQIYYMARCIGKPMPIDAEKIAFMKEFVSKSYGQK